MGNIKFIQDSHKYFSDRGELISVSSFTDRFKEKTDWTAVAAKLALKKTKEGTPTTKNDILEKWNLKRIASAKAGTALHEEIELATINEGIVEEYGIKCNVKECIHREEGKFSIPIETLENNTVYPELIIYDVEHMLCGQSDKVIVADGKIHIWDYKTDAQISFVGYSNKWMEAKKLLAPLSHLDECNGNIYSIKMSLYMYMLWKANKGKLKPGEIILEHHHLKRDEANDGFPIFEDGKPVVLKKETIRLPYRKKEVMDMLKTLKK
jgi:hypothetical protein